MNNRDATRRRAGARLAAGAMTGANRNSNDRRPSSRDEMTRPRVGSRASNGSAGPQRTPAGAVTGGVIEERPRAL